MGRIYCGSPLVHCKSDVLLIRARPEHAEDKVLAISEDDVAAIVQLQNEMIPSQQERERLSHSVASASGQGYRVSREHAIDDAIDKRGACILGA